MTGSGRPTQLGGSDLDARKHAMRRELKQRRRSLSPGHADRAGEAIARLLSSAAEFQAAHTVALFASLPDEPATRPLFDAAISAGKSVLLPRIHAAATLEFFRVVSWMDLGPGRYGVLEPPAGQPAVPIGAMDLALVPGVAFDRVGRRLGRGKGYYDRTFARSRPEAVAGPLLVGMAFAFQLVDSVPAGALDRAMDAVVTEEGLFRIAAPDT